MSPIPGRPGRASKIVVELLARTIDPARAELLRVDEKGAEIRFEAGSAPALCLTTAVELRFSDGESGTRIGVRARVRTRKEAGSGRRYGLAFLDQRAVREQILPYLHGEGQQRAAVRVRPPASAPIQVVLETTTGKGRLTGRVVDLSEGGLSIQVRPEDEDPFADTTRATASFRVPGAPATAVRLAVDNCERRLVGTVAQFALRFVPECSPGYQEHREAILEYVADRRRDSGRRAG